MNQDGAAVLSNQQQTINQGIIRVATNMRVVSMVEKQETSPYGSPTRRDFPTAHQGPSYRFDASTYTMFQCVVTRYQFFTFWKLQFQHRFILLFICSMQLRLKPKGDEIEPRRQPLLSKGEIYAQNPYNSITTKEQSKTSGTHLGYTASSRNFYSSSLDGTKRHRSRDNENDENGWRPPKKAKIQKIEKYKRRKYMLACHFHVHDPRQYSSATSDARYKMCEGPGWKSLTLLKEHLVSQHHVVPFCSALNRLHSCLLCAIDRSSQTQLVTHINYEGLSVENEYSSRSLESSKCRSMGPPVGLDSDFADAEQNAVGRWFHIWNLLFPESQPPNTPWCESDYTENLPLNNKRCESLCSLDTAQNLTPLFIHEDDSCHPGDWETEIDPSYPLMAMSNTPSLVFNTTFIASPNDCDTWSYESSILETTTAYSYDSTSVGLVEFPSRYDIKDPAWDEHLCYQSRLIDMDKFAPSVEDLHKLYPEAILSGLLAFDNIDGLLGLDPLDIAWDDAIFDPIEDIDIQPDLTNSKKVPEELVIEQVTDPDLKPENTPIANPVDRWLVDSNDPYEVRRLAVAETMAAEPELAKIAMSLFDSQWRLESLSLSPGVISCTTEDTPAQTTTPSSIRSPTNKRKTHRSGKVVEISQPDEHLEDEEEEDEVPRQKRPKGGNDKDSGPIARKFSCPFHKRHPTIYCTNRNPNAETREQKKWSVCGAQGFIKLKYLVEDHLERHRIFDCNSCFKQFDNSDEYMGHYDDGTCTKSEPRIGPRRDGIDVRQWIEIRKIFKTRAGKNYSDADKWMAIWGIIFPNAPHPRDPWASGEFDDTVQLPASAPAIESLLGKWRTLIQAEILASKEFPFDIKGFDIMERLLRKAFEIESKEADLKTQQLASPLPTPRPTSISSTPRSMQGTSADGGLPSGWRHNTFSDGQMRPPASPVSSTYTGHDSGQFPRYDVPGTSNTISTITNASNQIGPRIQDGTVNSGTRSGHSDGSSKHQKIAENLTTSSDSQDYVALDQNMIGTATVNPVLGLQASSAIQIQSHLNAASHLPSNARSVNPQTQNVYEQRNRESLVQRLSGLVNSICEISSELGVPQPMDHASDEGQLRESVLPTYLQEFRQGSPLGFQSLPRSNSFQVFSPFAAQGMTARNGRISQRQSPAPGMEAPQHRGVLTSSSPSASWYTTMPPDDTTVLNTYNGLQPLDPSLQLLQVPPGQQSQMQPQLQPQLQVLSDSNNLDIMPGLNKNGEGMFDNANLDWIMNLGHKSFGEG